MSTKTIALLVGRGASSDIVFNALQKEFEIGLVIVEDRVPRKKLLARRLRRMGLFRVVGQVCFQLLVVPILEFTARRRKQQIKTEHNLDDRPIDPRKLVNIASVNSAKAASLLQEYKPSVVIINGTRIIHDKILQSVSARFINTHAGITPLYRGVHGGYWALCDRNKAACGVTVHLVDSGIDTGGILAQTVIEPTQEDNFVTYPLLQLAAGLPLLKQAIRNELAGCTEIKPFLQGESKLWSHPTIVQYLRNRLLLGVK